MLGTKLSFYTTPRTLRGAARWGTLCVAVALLPLIAGCPMPTACSGDPCDDGDPCTTDMCTVDDTTDDGFTCANDPVDCGDQVCNPDDGECVDCVANADCDNGAFCDGAETCDTDTNTCVDGEEPCDPDTEVCDEDTDECLPTCDTDADCADDGDPCTIEACVDGACETTNRDCDDGLFCTGVEFCDADDADADADGCVSPGDPCADGEVCDEDADACSEGTACTEDADCPDDGLFCNGTESCDTDAGFCTSSGDPCEEGETCDEDLNQCTVDIVEMIDFTLGTDNVSGTANADTFSAPLLFNAPTGTNVPSLQTGDEAAGGDGMDSLNATFNFGGATTVAPTLGGIETHNITDFGTAATTLGGTGITGATAFNFRNSTNTNAFTITNLPNLVDVGVKNQAVGATLTFATAASDGSSDEATLTVDGLTGAGTTVTLTTGTTNGIETLSIAANNTASSFSDVAMNGTTLTTVNVSGDANLTLTTSLDANVTTVNASGATANTTLTQTNAGAFTYTGGAGNDSMTLGATFGTTDTLDGAGGTDTLGGTTAALGGTTSNQTNVSNFEKLAVSDAHTTALNVSHFGSITGVDLLVGSNTGTITNASSGINVSCGARATNPNGGGTLTVSVSGSATTDEGTLTLNDCDQTGLVTFTGFETLNLVSNLDLDGSAAAGGTAGVNTLTGGLTVTDSAATEKVVVTGTEALTLGAALAADEVDASGFGHNFIMGAATTPAGAIINGGSGSDTLFGSSGADIINGNSGADTLNALAGSDIVSGGVGADTFRQSAGAANGVDRQTISDFNDTPTSGDVFNLNSGLATLTGTDNFGSSSSIQTHSSAGNLTVNAAAEVVIVTSATVTDLTSANSLNGTNLLTAVGGTITGAIAGQNDILICVADTSGNVGVYHASSADNSIIAGEITLVAVLQGADVTLANLVFNNFSNGA